MADLAILKQFYPVLTGLLPRGVHHYPQHRYFFTGYPCGTLFDWDQYFEALILGYCGWPTDYTINGVRIFLDRQREDGFIARSAPPTGAASYFKHQVHIKPFLAQILLLVHQQENNLDWLTRNGYYDKLKKYLDFWLVKMDKRNSGLSVWHESEHTGMDNQRERAGFWGENELFCEGVDLNCYLVRECRAMAIISGLLGMSADEKYFSTAAENKAEAINKYLWSEPDGIYYDFNITTNEPIRQKYIGAFFPMWANIADKKQAAALLEHYLNEKEFNRPWGVPVIAADDPHYTEGFHPGDNTRCCSWRAHIWVPVDYLVIRGLVNYGYRAEAEELAGKLGKLFCRGPFSEYYTSESGIGTGRKPFIGWTALVPFLTAELEMGLDPTRLSAGGDDFERMRKFININLN